MANKQQHRVGDILYHVMYNCDACEPRVHVSAVAVTRLTPCGFEYKPLCTPTIRYRCQTEHGSKKFFKSESDAWNYVLRSIAVAHADAKTKLCRLERKIANILEHTNRVPGVLITPRIAKLFPEYQHMLGVIPRKKEKAKK